MTTHRPRITVFDLPVSAVIRSLAAQGVEKQAIAELITGEGVSVNNSTLNTQCYHGRKHAAGEESGGALIDLPDAVLKKVGAKSTRRRPAAKKKTTKKKATKKRAARKSK